MRIRTAGWVLVLVYQKKFFENRYKKPKQKKHQ
jgi:hypothetical protein